MSKISITLEDIFDIESAEIYNPDSLKAITSVSIDSRNIGAGYPLFIAIKGKKFDGHNFIADAVANGAKAIMINKSKFKLAADLDIPVIIVKDTTLALGEIAKIWRSKFTGKVIGITGSAGKTTTKEMLSIMLSEKYKVNKTLSNNNNHIGVPLTILSTNNKHDVLVLELGTNHFGEIAYTAEIAKPDYAVITNIANSHLEFLKNKKGVLKEKSALLTNVKKEGKVFINNDDELLSEAGKTFKNKVTYAFNNKANVKAKVVSYDELARPIIEIKTKELSERFTLPMHGEQAAKNFLTCAVIALNLGLNNEDIQKSLSKIKNVGKRLNIYKQDSNLIIDDTYNANPESMKSSIQLVGNIKTYKNKVAVLGDMFELGLSAPKMHAELINTVKESKLDAVYTIGSLMKNLADKLDKTKISHRHFISRPQLKRFIKENAFSDSVILFKGSRGMKMEEFLEVLESK